jgi:hypothetical protein
VETDRAGEATNGAFVIEGVFIRRIIGHIWPLAFGLRSWCRFW